MVKALEEKEVLFTNFNNILGAVLKDPTLWTKPEFQPLRDFTTTIISNPQKFTHALPDSLEKKKLDGPSKHPPFSKGIARSLYARERERRERERIYIYREREREERRESHGS